MLFGSLSSMAWSADSPQHGREVIRQRNFYTDRGLKDYIATLPGAGEAFFSEQYVMRQVDMNPETRLTEDARVAFLSILAAPTGQRPRVVALDYQIKRRISVPSDRLKILKGRFFEEISDEEIGSLDFVVDLYGIFAYSAQPDEVLRRYWRLLKAKGLAYILLSQSENGFAREGLVQARDGRELSLLDWLRSFSNASLSVIQGKSAVTGFGKTNFSLRLEKNTDNLYIPRLLLIETKTSDKGGPPIRVFKEK